MDNIIKAIILWHFPGHNNYLMDECGTPSKQMITRETVTPKRKHRKPLTLDLATIFGYDTRSISNRSKNK